MAEPNTTYVLLLATAGIVSGVVVLVVWRRRSAPLARPALLLTIALTWWSSTYALHWSGISRPSPFFWLDATYLGVVIAPTALLAFALRYVGQDHLLTRRMMGLLFIEPILTLILLWTDSWHALFFAGLRTPASGAILAGGIWFWTNAIYSYVLILAATLILLQAFWRAPRLYRGQLGTMLLGASMPWVGNIIGLLHLSPLPNLDLTPILFTLTSVAFTYGLARYGFLDIVPAARDMLVEVMGEGVLVLDGKNRIVDLNSSARRLLWTTRESQIGKTVETALVAWPELVSICQNASEGQHDFTVQTPRSRYLNVRVNPMFGRGGSVAGHLLTLSDITERKRAERDLERANEQLKLQLTEIETLHDKLREEAVRDPLTGLHNRRYLVETLPRELARAGREQRPLCVALIDIDQFKQVNDTHGHKGGDIMLQAVAALIANHTRVGDVLCRYGGEEFLLVLPGASPAAALSRMIVLCSLVLANGVPYRDAMMFVTLSIGLASYPQHGTTEDALLHCADEALYRAKNSGRNRVVLFD